MAELTAEYVRSRLDYDPETGILTWRDGTKYAGKQAGSPNGDGYILIQLDGHKRKAHRLAWLIVHGEWLDYGPDHRDQDKANNRINNLRRATHAQNMGNQPVRKNNTSGFKGVSWSRETHKFRANIRVAGKLIYLGEFARAVDAAAKYNTAAVKHFGDFASPNHIKGAA